MFFDKETHTYTNEKGETYISVTTLLGSWFNQFNEKEELKKIRRDPAKLKKYEGMTDEEIKLQWETGGLEASRLGTELHHHIENYLNGNKEYMKDRALIDVEYKYFLDFIETPLVTKGVEWRVWNDDVLLAGTIDYVSQNKDGTVDLYDWKRCKSLTKPNGGFCLIPELMHIPYTNFWKYTLQLNIYKWLIEKRGEKVKRMYIVCFHPINLGYQKYQVADLDLENVLNRSLKV
jgi:hypothetical protein